MKTSTTVKADTKILEYAIEAYHAAFEKLKGVENLLFSITFEALPGSLMERSIVKGGNSLGLNPSDSPVVVVLFYTSWDKPNDDRKVYDVNKEALENIDNEAKNRDVSAIYRYSSYTSPEKALFGSFGPESKRYLKTITTKYDPDGFFQITGAGPFKLSK